MGFEIVVNVLYYSKLPSTEKCELKKSNLRANMKMVSLFILTMVSFAK